MIETKVEISEQLLSLPDRLQRAADEAHEQSARELVGEVRAQIIGVGAVASKALLNSISKQFENRGVVKAWSIGSDLDYGVYVERGRPSGTAPPTDAILRWMTIKRIEPLTRGVAFVIARSIGKRGIKGRFPFRRALEAHIPRMQEIFETTLQAVINE